MSERQEPSGQATVNTALHTQSNGFLKVFISVLGKKNPYFTSDISPSSHMIWPLAMNPGHLRNHEAGYSQIVVFFPLRKTCQEWQCIVFNLDKAFICDS